jgi:ribonucleoside-triphosphate reductase
MQKDYIKENNMSVDTYFQDYIHKSRYARYLPEEKRREEWPETVTRYLEFWVKRGVLSHGVLYNLLYTAILNKEVMPSMRAMMTAGPALERDHIAGYNCGYGAIEDVDAFDELMYILMCGTGVGFSVERQYLGNLPCVADTFHKSGTNIIVDDSKEGWCKAVKSLISSLYVGRIPNMDLSLLRPEGAPLKTFGGRSSGPAPLKALCDNLIVLFRNAHGRKLTSIECHDVCCYIAGAVVVGGVRRSALISLSNLSDGRMAKAKSGEWWLLDPQRSLANNSVCYTESPDVDSYMDEFITLIKSNSGERGIFSREAADKKVATIGRRETGHDWGTNPCSEIILRNKQFCNLTEVVVRKEDTLDTLHQKCHLASILGTFQSTLTDFKYISDKWKFNCEEERLLGVSLTGIMDNAWMSDVSHSKLLSRLAILKREVILTNEAYAKKLGIPQSTATTCVKPSGTVSQLVDSASGIHPRHSEYYIRRVRNSIYDPLGQHMIESGVPYEIDAMDKTKTTAVFSFPMKAPEGAVVRANVSAIQHLEIWKVYAEHWCEHKPSITVTYTPQEVPGIMSWVWDNIDIMSGVTFLPYDGHVYLQPPYEEIDESTYVQLLKEFEDSQINSVSFMEEEDNTTGSQELACSGAESCEVL